MSISSTFYEQPFCGKVLCTAFFTYGLCLWFFLAKEIVEKAFCKMLVKLPVQIDVGHEHVQREDVQEDDGN